VSQWNVGPSFRLLENIKHLQGHVIDIQKREVAKMNAYAQALNPGADSKDEEAEVTLVMTIL